LTIETLAFRLFHMTYFRPADSVESDEVPTIGKLVVLQKTTDAGVPAKRWHAKGIRGNHPFLQDGHRNGQRLAKVTLGHRRDGLFNHLPITRFEDVQVTNGVGIEHNAHQGEEWDRIPEID
jgi:hypothetical protein